ncbi:MAG: hypothetical protein NVS9B2_30150 [Steroidobacteraceae bacterium]
MGKPSKPSPKSANPAATPAGPGGARAGAGRPAAKFNVDEVEKLASMHCTAAEIGAFFGVSKRTLERHMQDQDVQDAMERGRAKGRISIRRAQIKLMQEGHAGMAMFLGKNFLGQRSEPDSAASQAEEPKQLLPEWMIKSLRRRADAGTISPSPAPSDSTISKPSTTGSQGPSARANPTPSDTKLCSSPSSTLDYVV